MKICINSLKRIQTAHIMRRLYAFRRNLADTFCKSPDWSTFQTPADSMGSHCLARPITIESTAKWSGHRTTPTIYPSKYPSRWHR